MQQQRIFITRSEVPGWPYVPSCAGTELVPSKYVQQYFGSGVWVPLALPNDTGAVLGALQECTDCTLQGGILTKPSFWPN